MESEEVFIHHLSSISMGGCNNKQVILADFLALGLYDGMNT
jgi:hypothetical protein